MNVQYLDNSRLDSEQYYVDTNGYGRRDIAQAMAFEGETRIGLCFLELRAGVPYFEYYDARGYLIERDSDIPQTDVEKALRRTIEEKVTLAYITDHKRFFEEVQDKYNFLAWQIKP